MFRNVWAICAGLVTAVVVYTLTKEIGDFLYPLPADLHSSDLDSVRRYHSQLPVGAISFIIAKPTAAALMGTLAAGYIGTASSSLIGAIVGGVVLTYSIAYFIAVPYPLWLALAALIGIVISTYLATLLAPRSASRAMEPD